MQEKAINEILLTKSYYKGVHIKNLLIKFVDIPAVDIPAVDIPAVDIPAVDRIISYNHFKGFKRDFNYNLYKSINLVRFWLKSALKGFKKGINKIIRLKIYKWSLVKIMLLISTIKIFEIIMDFNKIILKMILISSFGWRDILTKRYGRICQRFAKVLRFGGYLNLISG